jgi:type I restriction enzyme, S subunit
MTSDPPNEWGLVSLGDLIDVAHGFAFSGEFFTDEETSFIVVTPGNFAVGGGFKASKLKYYKRDGPVPEAFVLNPGELIVTMTDLSKGSDTLGFGAFVPVSGGLTYLHNQRIGRVLARNGASIDLAYIHWLLRSPGYRHFVIATATGTTVKHTSPRRISEYTFALPPFAEQRRIAAILDAFDQKIESNQLLAARCSEVADRIFDQVIARASANRRPLADVAVIHKATIAPAERPDEWFEHFSIPAFDEEAGAAIEPGAAMLSAKTQLPECDTILMSKLNPATPRIWWPRPTKDFVSVCSPEFIVLTPRDGCPASFIYASFRRDRVLYDEILSHATGTTGSRQRVKPHEVMSCRVIDAAQYWERFDAETRPLYDRSAAASSESRRLAVIRDTLLPKLVSGHLRVPATYDPDDARGTRAEESAVGI